MTYHLFGTGKSPAYGEWYPTAFLDGLRGVACIAVFNDHLMNLLVKWNADGWGHNSADYRLVQLPILRLIFRGDLAVRVFFVISGFALSVSTVKLIHSPSRDTNTFVRILASAVLRRPIRLFLPVWVSTIPVFVCYRLGVFEALLPLRGNDILEGWALSFPRNDTLGLQTLDLIQENTRMLNIFRPGEHGIVTNRYNDPAWTIPLEFRASLMLYLSQLALFFLRRRVRFALLACAIALCLLFSGHDMPLFWSGFMLADSFFAPRPDVNLQTTLRFTARTMLWTALATFTFLIALWFGSYPAFQPEITPGYIWLTRLVPPFRESARLWYQIVSAIMLVTVIVYAPSSHTEQEAHKGLFFRLCCLPKDFLSSPFCRYLGKISYALYLMHGLTINTVGVLLFYNTWTLTGKENVLLFGVGTVCAYALLLSTVVWVADLFWRLVDQPCVNLGRWMQQWSLERNETK